MTKQRASCRASGENQVRPCGTESPLSTIQHETYALCRQLLDSLNDSVWLLDPDHRIIHCNKASCGLFNRKAEKIIGRYCWEILRDVNDPLPECAICDMHSCHQRESREFSVDGRWYHVTVDPLDLPEGASPATIQIIRDITKTKKIQEEFRRLNGELEVRVKERTAELGESEAKYRFLIENTSDIPFSIDSDGIVRYIGPQAELYGFDPKAIEGRHFLEMLFPDDRERIAADFMQTVAEGIGMPAEFRIQTPTGTVHWFEERSTIQSDPSGEVTGFTGMLRDITEQKEIEQALQVSEARCKELFSSMSNGVAIYKAVNNGEDFVFTDINKAGERISRLKREDILGRSALEIFPKMREFGLFDVLRRVWQTGRSEQHPCSLYEDDRVQEWVENNVFKLKTGEIVAVYNKLTRMKETERALRLSEIKFRTLAEQLPNIIFINYHGRIVYVNPLCEQEMGYTREELYAEDFDFFTLLQDESAKLVKSRLHRYARGETPPPCEITIIKKSGQTAEAILSTKQIDYEGGQAFLGVITDISAMKRAELIRIEQQEQLQRLAAKLASAQDDEQRRIAAGLHDDVAQLITAGSMKIAIAKRCKDLRKKEQFYEEIDQLLHEANDKIRMLSFELASSTLYRLGLHEALNELCESMTERYGIRFSAKGKKHRGPMNEACATVLFKAARELLFNVVKHADAEKATVYTEHDGELIRLVVEDNGRGFPDAGHGKINPGKGLGLFGIQERLRDLGGKMEIESGSGQLTRVTLWAPTNHTQRIAATQEISLK